MSKPKPRLGRGLSSLMSLSQVPDQDLDAAVATEPSDAPDTTGLPGTAIRTIPLEQIVPNPHQPRKQFNETALSELSASIQSNGLIQPILVRATEGGQFELIAGERRWRAAQHAGLAEIPAIIRNVDPLIQAQLALIENIQREDLNPIDRAAAYRYLMEQLGLTQIELAARLGEDRSTIANFLRLLDLAPTVRDKVADNQLSVGHAKLLAALPPQEQERLANLAVSQGLSVRNLERLSQQGGDAKPAPAPKSATSAHLQELERSITRQVGLRAQIHSGAKNKGRLVIHYASLDQFDTLLERLGIKLED
jgi:ParB family chromosome partitioning protein